ncbi:MAG: glycosyltransferase [Alphaproteobacteria bacterium]|nr:glycosyltransferase [Alphaproteobacteria bacterium]
MHLAFVDFIYHYDAARPDTDEPLGGTTSAICFLAREMVQNGIACTFFNRVAAPCHAHGITSLPLQNLGDEIERGGYDAYIFCGRWTAELVGLVRKHTQAPLIAWMHESVFAAPMTPALADFDGVVFVSEWQQRINQQAALPNWKQAVIRNAMNPLVATSLAANEPVLAAKCTPPVLLFIGSFARGAFHIPPLIEKIRAERSDFSVEMFCNLNPSHDAARDAAYVGWLREQPNIAHIGMVGQPALTRHMRRASILLAPNPWPETSCIALIESLASGMTAVTTNRAALPETGAGFARQILIEDPDEPARFDMPVDYDAFATAVLDALHMREKHPDELEERLRRQVDFFLANYQWAGRVAPWVEFIEGVRNKET